MYIDIQETCIYIYMYINTYKYVENTNNDFQNV